MFPRFSLLPELRRKIADRVGRNVASTTVTLRQASASDLSDAMSHAVLPVSNDTDREINACIDMFRAYRRLGELYDMDRNTGVRTELEQDTLIKALFAARIANALRPEEFARHRQYFIDEYGLERFDNFLYVSFPRRRGKSMALAIAIAVLLTTQINFKVMVVNLGSALVVQNLLYINQIFGYLANDPDHVIKCGFERGGKILEYTSHHGTRNTLACIPNPDRSKEAPRGLGGNLVLFDEAQFYREGTFKTVMPVAQLGTTVCMISSLGSNENAAAQIANRRDEYGRLVFRHYVIEAGLLKVNISTDEPGEGPAFGHGKNTIQHRAWYTMTAPTPEAIRDISMREDMRRRRRFNLMCLSLPNHISLRNFIALSIVMGENDFNQEIASVNSEDDGASGSRKMFSQVSLERIGQPGNIVHLTSSMPQPTRIIIAVDPSGGGKGSEFPIATFAYYANGGPAQQLPMEQKMVVRPKF